MKDCKVPNCEKVHYGLGYCTKHYWRFKRYGDPLMCKNIERRKRFRSDNLKRPNLTESQQINISSIFNGIRP